MHVDIHGKYDRKNSYELDLGIACMHAHWENKEHDFVSEFDLFLTKGFNSALKGLEFKEFEATCNNAPYLNGYWGGNLFTMTE
jgi:hypothetical protein